MSVVVLFHLANLSNDKGDYTLIQAENEICLLEQALKHRFSTQYMNRKQMGVKEEMKGMGKLL